MNAWDTVLGQRTMEHINSISQDLDKVVRNYPTLRDQFAMQVLNAEVGSYASYYRNAEAFAEHCYEIADAMLAERSKEN